jgi:stage III sporulation protein AA
MQMTCAWKEFLAILPPWLGQELDKSYSENLQELRLRLDQNPQLICKNGIFRLHRKVSAEDLSFCINTASRYSPWTAATSAQGYLTASGGHRIGLCGEAIVNGGKMTGIRTVRSLCIRVARDFPDIAARFGSYTGSILIIGPPGSGKTTLLRDLIRQISAFRTVAVVDERRELFPEGMFLNRSTVDVLSGCPKSEGIEILLRTMGPQTIAVDEITAESDCLALQQALRCGVQLIATAHASSVADLRSRPLYKLLLQQGNFEHILIMSRDKTLRQERMNL